MVVKGKERDVVALYPPCPILPRVSIMTIHEYFLMLLLSSSSSDLSSSGFLR